MQAVVHNAANATFLAHLEEGQIYDITGVLTIMADKKYKIVQYPYQLLLPHNIKIESSVIHKDYLVHFLKYFNHIVRLQNISTCVDMDTDQLICMNLLKIVNNLNKLLNF